jgi:hypothetical protein
MAVRFSALRAGRPLPAERFPVLISLMGWVDPRTIVRLGLGKLKAPVYTSQYALLPAAAFWMRNLRMWSVNALFRRIQRQWRIVTVLHKNVDRKNNNNSNVCIISSDRDSRLTSVDKCHVCRRVTLKLELINYLPHFPPYRPRDTAYRGARGKYKNYSTGR